MSILWQPSAPKTLAGLLIVIVAGCLSLSGPARADDYYAWAVGDTNVHPPTTELRCPGGMFVTKITGRENEWLAHIQIYCTPPDTATGSHFNTNPGPEAGGDGGGDAHDFTLDCNYNVVDGLTGLETSVRRNYNVVTPPKNYAADLHAYCGNLNAPGQSVQSDPSFKRSGDIQVSYREMNELYPDPGLQEHFHCPTNWGATGLWYGLGNVEHDDIAAVGLICAPLPGAPAPETPTAENPPPASPPTNVMTSVLSNSTGVQVGSGTYGASCGQSEGNVTEALAKQCNGTTDCQYVVDYTVIGDPAPGCKKDYVAKWTCPGGQEKSARAEAEAGLRSIVELKCP